MQVWMVGESDEQLAVWLERYLAAEVRMGLPEEAGGHVVIAAGCTVPENALDIAQAVVLVEPEMAEKDRMIRLLAAKIQPRLVVVSNVAARIRAERTWSLLLALATRIPQATLRMRAEPVTRSDLTATDATGGSWIELDGARTLSGQVIGFIGFTPMAWTMAEFATQFGMFPVYWAETGDTGSVVEAEGAALRSGARNARFDDLLSEADVVVLDVPFSEPTTRLIDAPELALMRADALLVNTAHGRVIDEGALIQALRDGRMAGVALDRFNYEPLPGDSPLRTFERVVLTPGIAAPTADEILERAAAEVARMLSATNNTLATGRRVSRVRRRTRS